MRVALARKCRSVERTQALAKSLPTRTHMNKMIFPVYVMLAAVLLPSAPLGAAVADAPVRGLIQRLVPGHAKSFAVEFIPADNGQDVSAVTPDPILTLAAFGVAVALGAAGSLYPAWKASRISPMEALRYE